MSDTVSLGTSSTWQSVFDEISVGREGQDVTLEILDQDFGDQTEAQHMPFRSIGYDQRGDVIVIALGGVSSRWPVVLRHLIHQPRGVDALERAGGGLVLRVVDADDAATLLSFTP